MIPASLLAAATLATAAPPPLAFPTFMLVRGGGLAEPVLLYHHGVWTKLMHLGGDTTRPAVPVAMVDSSPIATIHSDMSQLSRIPPDEHAGSVRAYEVAEFWAMGADEHHRPRHPLRWESATDYAMLHVRRGASPIYVRTGGVMQPRGSGGLLGDRAVAVLEKWGIPMHEERP